MIATSFTAQLIVAGQQSIPVAVTLHYYSVEDPFAVRAIFEFGEDKVDWTFARELLILGTANDVGNGDVRVYPSLETDAVILSLSSPEGDALLELPRQPLVGFINRTTALVPVGEEDYDVDLLIANLLDSSL